MRSVPKKAIAALALTLAMVVAAVPALAAGPGNAAALKGVKTGKVVFDINLTSIKPLPTYLMAIKATYNGLKQAGVEPVVVLAFRGTAVNYVLKTAKDKFPEVAPKVLAQLKELSGMGVVVEACNLAMSLQNIDSAQVLPDVEVVGNTFISLIGYQAQGYAVIAIQ